MAARYDSKVNSSLVKRKPQREPPDGELAHATPDIVLAAPAQGRILRFLSQWANVTESKAERRLAKLFPEFHAASFKVSEHLRQKFAELDRTFDGTIFKPIMRNWTNALKDAWREPNGRVKNWKLARLLSEALALAAFGRDSLWEPDPPHSWADNLADTIIHALRISDRLKVCSNHECPAPLFIIKRKNQRQCSPECAAYAQRKAKLEYWNRIGKRRRKTKGKKQSKRREKRK